MDKIIIKNLEVWIRAGVTEEERAKPQRLLLYVEMDHDFQRAAVEDNLDHTIDYHAVSQRLLKFGETREWRLIETLAEEITSLILDEFRPKSVFVQVKKFILPEAEWVGVSITRPE